MLIITNNKMIEDEFRDLNVCFLENASYLQVLEFVRDKIHLGHKLLTHPLASSLKPNEQPFKTIIISKRFDYIDFDSLQIIEESIKTTLKFLNNAKPKNWSSSILEDFRLIDFSLFAPDSLRSSNYIN